MSRTRKQYVSGCNRQIRNHKQCLTESYKDRYVEELGPAIRKASIPPDPWNDISHDPQVILPLKIAHKMAKQNKTEDEVRNMLRDRKVNNEDIKWILSFVFEKYLNR